MKILDKKLLAIIILCLLFASCTTREARRYQAMCDSLNRLDIPPRVFDTLFFHKYENGSIVDTIYPDGKYEWIQTIYNGNYYRLMRDKDCPIVNAMQYDKENYYIGIRNFFMEKPYLLIL